MGFCYVNNAAVAARAAQKAGAKRILIMDWVSLGLGALKPTFIHGRMPPALSFVYCRTSTMETGRSTSSSPIPRSSTCPPIDTIM